jgi:hypothetical protein
MEEYLYKEVINLELTFFALFSCYSLIPGICLFEVPSRIGNKLKLDTVIPTFLDVTERIQQNTRQIEAGQSNSDFPNMWIYQDEHNSLASISTYARAGINSSLFCVYGLLNTLSSEL